MTASTVVASAVALVAALAPAVNVPAAFAPAENVLEIGGPSGGFVILTGSTATFTNIQFGACNSLSWGYQLNGGSNQVQASFPGGCGSASAPNVKIGPFASQTTLRVFLTDNNCSATYYSDGLPVDHVIVQGSNPYTLRFADGGGFCERASTTTNSFPGCNLCISLAISDQLITASGKSFSAVEGQPVAVTVATFTDPDSSATAADYTSTIDWGDGTTSTGTITGTTTFSVAGTHTYSEEGSYQVSVTITDADNLSNDAKVTPTADVADAVLTASPACSATTLGSYNGRTASFTDAAAPAGTASDFTATIDWGDGNVTTGTVSATGGGSYDVTGAHAYPSTGAFTIATSIKDVGGSSAATSCITVGFAFAPGGGSFVIGNQGAALGQTVTFWGAQWAKFNAGDQKALRSFKGFAESPASPTCGADWSGDPGNSTPPPSGSLPTYMGVIVTTSPTKSGSGISGHVVHIVVVKTNPGYAPDPGHAGTGTVVAVVC